MLCLQPQVTWNSNRGFHSSSKMFCCVSTASLNVMVSHRPSLPRSCFGAGVDSQGTALKGSHVEVAWGLQETNHQDVFGEYFCSRFCGLESLPAWAFLSALLHNSSLIGLVSLRKLGGWCKRKRVLGVSVLGGMSPVCVWKACGSVGRWLSSYTCLQTHLSVYMRLKMGDCKCKYRMASSFFLQFNLEKLRFPCFSKDATVFAPRLNDISYKSKRPGSLLWATIPPPLHCWAAWAKPRSLPRCGRIFVVLCDSYLVYFGILQG